MTRKIRFAAVIALLSVLLLGLGAACGDDDGDEDGEDTPVATADETAGATAPAENGETAEPNGESGDATPGADATPGDSGSSDDVSPADQAAVTALTEDGLAAIRDRDMAALRAIMTDEANDRTDDDEITEIFDCYAAATLRDPPMGTVSGKDRVRVEVFFVVSAGGQEREVPRRWEYERQTDGSWLLFQPPQCPPD